MKLTGREEAKLMKLLDEIDRETQGRGRAFVTQNRTRQIRLIIRKANRRERELDARARTRGVQLLLFEDK